MHLKLKKCILSAVLAASFSPSYARLEARRELNNDEGYVIVGKCLVIVRRPQVAALASCVWVRMGKKRVPRGQNGSPSWCYQSEIPAKTAIVVA